MYVPSWPYWYLKKVGTDVSAPRRRDIIMSQLENFNGILSKYAIYLEEQDDCNIFSFSRMENSRIDTTN